MKRIALGCLLALCRQGSCAPCARLNSADLQLNELECLWVWALIASGL